MSTGFVRGEIGKFSGGSYALLCLVFMVACGRNEMPLRAEFVRAIERDRIAAQSDLVGPHGPSEVTRFIEKHGDKALPLYRQILEVTQSSQSQEDLAQAKSAMQGLVMVAPAETAPRLKRLTGEPSVHPEIAFQATLLLAGMPGQDETQVLGDRLLNEKDWLNRIILVELLLRTADPKAIVALESRKKIEDNAKVTKSIDTAVDVLRLPDRCTRVSEYHEEGSKWQCYYRCPKGELSSFLYFFKTQCPASCALKNNSLDCSDPSQPTTPELAEH